MSTEDTKRGRVLRVDHLGVAVRDPRERLKLWGELFELPLERVEAVPSEGVRTWFVDAGGTHVELLEALDEDSTIAKYVGKRGEGIHHLCLEVDDIDAVLARLFAAGIEPIGGGARPGAGGCRVAFLHPKVTGGVLLELSQHPESGAHGARKGGVAEETQVHPGEFGVGELAVAYLRDPRERLFGIIERHDALGLSLTGLDLESWDDWVAQRKRGEEGPLVPSTQFFPTSRIEKLLADRDAPGLPSLARGFAERTGDELVRALRRSGEEGARPA